MGKLGFLGDILKPSILKLGVTLVVPAGVSLLVTRHIENVIDFYGYLLTPMMPFYDGKNIIYIINYYLFLWIPFYLVACAMVFSIRQVRLSDLKKRVKVGGSHTPARDESNCN
jgi:hypothetical protein